MFCTECSKARCLISEELTESGPKPELNQALAMLPYREAVLELGKLKHVRVVRPKLIVTDKISASDQGIGQLRTGMSLTRHP